MLQCDLFIILIRFSTFVNIINSIATIINITKNKKNKNAHRMEGYIFHCSTYVQHSPATHVVNCSNDIGYYCIIIIERKKKHLNRMEIFILSIRPALDVVIQNRG